MVLCTGAPKVLYLFERERERYFVTWNFFFFFVLDDEEDKRATKVYGLLEEIDNVDARGKK